MVFSFLVAQNTFLVTILLPPPPPPPPPHTMFGQCAHCVPLLKPHCMGGGDKFGKKSRFIYIIEQGTMMKTSQIFKVYHILRGRWQIERGPRVWTPLLLFRRPDLWKFAARPRNWSEIHYNSRQMDRLIQHVEERIGSFCFCSASSLTESSWSFRVSEGVTPPGNPSCKVKEDGNARVFGRRLLARFGIFNGFRVLCVGGLLLESTKLDSFLRSFWFRPGGLLFWRIFEGVSLSLESLVKIFDKERFKWQQSLTQTLRNFHRSRAPFSKLWQQFSWIPLNNGATRNGTGQHYAIR